MATTPTPGILATWDGVVRCYRHGRPVLDETTYPRLCDRCVAAGRRGRVWRWTVDRTEAVLWWTLLAAYMLVVLSAGGLLAGYDAVVQWWRHLDDPREG